jgi:hypothetical protein
MRAYPGIAIVGLALLATSCEPNSQGPSSGIRTGVSAPCPDSFCSGEALPPHDHLKQYPIKISGQWYLAPRNYFGGTARAGFTWYAGKSYSATDTIPTGPESASHATTASAHSVEIFLSAPRTGVKSVGSETIEWAERNGGVLKVTSLGPGLLRYEMNAIAGPDGDRLDRFRYYVATKLQGPDGRPPVAKCESDYRGGGSFGIAWRDDIFVGVRMGQSHCAAFPEIYLEVIRILGLIQKV